MARVLLVTGIAAEPIVRRVIAEVETKHAVDVVAIPVPVVAFLTAERVAEYLKAMGVSGYDYILLPGLVRGSGRVVEEATGVRALKGPTNVYDLREVLKFPDLSVLSPDVPADEVLEGLALEGTRRALEEIEEALNDSNSVIVGTLRVPLAPPPIRVASEVAGAHLLGPQGALREALRRVEAGADAVVLSFEALASHPDEVRCIVKALKGELGVPVGVFTVMPSEIEAALEAGADLILGLDLTNVERVSRGSPEVAVVALPRSPHDGSVPEDPEARAELLRRAVNAAIARGFRKVMADAVLEPFGGTLRSLLAFQVFKRVAPDIPLVMNLGNVVELVDADSVGLNALLVMLAHEAGVSMVVATERDLKTRGSTLEAKVSAQMAAAASRKRCPPRRLGISLLILKDERRASGAVEEGFEAVVDAEEVEAPYVPDPAGFFKIWVNHEDGLIEALHVGAQSRTLLRGRSAKALRYAIAARGLVSRVDHALYLGHELGKAEVALLLGKSYLQEAPLFTVPRPLRLGAPRRSAARKSLSGADDKAAS